MYYAILFTVKHTWKHYFKHHYIGLFSWESYLMVDIDNVIKMEKENMIME